MAAELPRRAAIGFAAASVTGMLLPATRAAAARRQVTASETVIGAGQWRPGTPAAPGPTVPREALLPLPGAMTGPEMVVSNNPETVTGAGWLTQHSRAGAARGGRARPLSGTFPLYLYHQNDTGGQAYLHVLISNPQASPVTVSMRGAAWTNADKPLVQDPASRAGTGPCHATSLDWLTGATRTYLGTTSVAAGRAVQAARIPMTGTILDGRFEITASGGVYVYTVVTTDGSATTAINLSQTDSAWARGNIASQTATTYGRESGVYAGSQWRTGRVTIEAGPPGSHLGLAVNTTQRQVATLDQTAPATAALTDSSQRSWGNYGARYDIDLALRNTGSTARTVDLTFGSNVTGTQDVPGNTWNGAVAVREDGGPRRTQTVYVRPTVPRDLIGRYVLAAGQERTVALEFYVPGLITAGSQLLLESVAG
ncbi:MULTISPECIES: DUF3370 family protein [unclassified Streptomyces]|uniref:DUF3370 family protein n=1 Tax=unclassified Streptomyces TaxID=2593676 RepID=UPI0035DACD9E